jgi:signal peptidase I
MFYERKIFPVAIGVSVCAIGIYAFAHVRHNFIVVTVRGTSMAPRLRPGDRVLVRRNASNSLRAGSVVVFRTPNPRTAWDSFKENEDCLSKTQWSIKRLVALPGDPVPEDIRSLTHDTSHVPPGMYVVIGDNYDRSTDSRHWGFLPRSQILGSAIHYFPRPGAPTSIVNEPIST